MLITFAVGSTSRHRADHDDAALYGDRSGRRFGLALARALVIITGYTSINAVCEGRAVPDRVRALGVALPYALANALFGGTAEYVALWFKKAGVESGFYWYVSGCAAVSLVVYLTMRETRDIDLNRVERAPSAAPAPVPDSSQAP